MTLKQQQFADIIRKITTEHGIDPDKAIQVAMNESSLNPDCVHKNKDRRKTIDRGLFQLNDFYYSHIPDSCAYNPECSTIVFCKAVKNKQAIDWYGACGIFWEWRVINGVNKKVLF